MSKRAYYGEELYFNDESIALNEKLEENIRLLLIKNKGVGIIGGVYGEGFPIKLISKLALQMLGYETDDEFEEKNGNLLSALLVREGDFSEDISLSPVTFDMQMKRRDGSFLWVRVATLDITDMFSNISWLISVCDIDSLKKHEQELLEAKEKAVYENNAKTLFLSKMSHDIRTPMNGILGMARIACENIDDKELVLNSLNKIINAGKQLKTLIDEVLDTSRLESGRTELVCEPFNLKDELLDICDIMRPLAKEKYIELFGPKHEISHESLSGRLPHIRRILENLITNAIKYTGCGGSVFVSVKEEYISDEEALFIFNVTDTGIGMSEEFQKHMYEPFVQYKTSEGGAGLGLTIIKELIDIMGGNIEAKSSLNNGSSFSVSLPIKLSGSVAVKTAKRKEGASLAGKTILLAEDNAMNREVAEYILTHAGAKTVSAVNGQEALDIFISSKEGRFDLILMDIIMPVKDGLEAARDIRSSLHPDAKKIPIIALTANDYAEDILKAKNVGMNAHIAKPIEAAKLINVLSWYVG